MNRKPTAERREEILDAAGKLLLRDGISSLTTATLAQEVGVTTGALFRHFETRDAILVALAERTAARLRDDLATHAEGPAPQRLEAFITARLGTVSKSPALPAMVLSPDVHLALPAEGRAALVGIIRDTHVFLRALIADGQRDGSFRADLRPEEAAVAVLGVLALHAMTRALPSPLAKGRDVAALALKLLSAPAAPAEATP